MREISGIVDFRKDHTVKCVHFSTRTFSFSNSYTDPINGSIIFTPGIRFPHQTRDTRRNWIVAGGRGYGRTFLG